jgi:hypothetical protein
MPSNEPSLSVISLERGYQANAALRHARGKAVQGMRARGSFQPIHDSALVPVLPCEKCRDGGLRVIGTVLKGGCIQRAHACDTCGTVQLYELPHDVVT